MTLSISVDRARDLILNDISFVKNFLQCSCRTHSSHDVDP